VFNNHFLADNLFHREKRKRLEAFPMKKSGSHHRKNLQEPEAPGDFFYFMTIKLSFNDYSHGSVSMMFTISTFSHFHSLDSGLKVELTKHFQFSSSQVGKSER
jgi:hypothetical protein